ncbi:MAG: hypothetical protein V4534_07595 [Myxococcota bacterium]
MTPEEVRAAGELPTGKVITPPVAEMDFSGAVEGTVVQKPSLPRRMLSSVVNYFSGNASPSDLRDKIGRTAGAGLAAGAYQLGMNAAVNAPFSIGAAGFAHLPMIGGAVLGGTEFLAAARRMAKDPTVSKTEMGFRLAFEHALPTVAGFFAGTAMIAGPMAATHGLAVLALPALVAKAGAVQLATYAASRGFFHAVFNRVWPAKDKPVMGQEVPKKDPDLALPPEGKGAAPMPGEDVRVVIGGEKPGPTPATSSNASFASTLSDVPSEPYQALPTSSNASFAGGEPPRAPGLFGRLAAWFRGAPRARLDDTQERSTRASSPNGSFREPLSPSEHNASFASRSSTATGASFGTPRSPAATRANLASSSSSASTSSVAPSRADIRTANDALRANLRNPQPGDWAPGLGEVPETPEARLQRTREDSELERRVAKLREGQFQPQDGIGTAGTPVLKPGSPEAIRSAGQEYQRIKQRNSARAADAKDKAEMAALEARRAALRGSPNAGTAVPSDADDERILAELEAELETNSPAARGATLRPGASSTDSGSTSPTLGSPMSPDSMRAGASGSSGSSLNTSLNPGTPGSRSMSGASRSPTGDDPLDLDTGDDNLSFASSVTARSTIAPSQKPRGGSGQR